MNALTFSIATALGALAPAWAWSQAAVESAYVEIVPAGSSDVDDVLAVERGVELVLCQAGVKPRAGGRETPAELKLLASLTKIDSDRCEFTDATAVLPGGARVALPGMAIIRIGAATGNSASFFLGCGASFTRAALDALKEKVTLQGPGCEAKPAMKKGLRRRPFE